MYDAAQLAAKAMMGKGPPDMMGKGPDGMMKGPDGMMKGPDGRSTRAGLLLRCQWFAWSMLKVQNRKA